MLAEKDNGDTRLKTGKNSIVTHPVVVGMVFFFLSREGPVPGVFRRLEGGGALVPASLAGVFRVGEGGGAPDWEEIGTVSSTT
jgi:hypothetical protein